MAFEPWEDNNIAMVGLSNIFFVRRMAKDPDWSSQGYYPSRTHPNLFFQLTQSKFHW